MILSDRSNLSTFLCSIVFDTAIIELIPSLSDCKFKLVEFFVFLFSSSSLKIFAFSTTFENDILVDQSHIGFTLRRTLAILLTLVLLTSVMASGDEECIV